LLVDHNEGVRRVLEQLLHNHGYRVIAAEDCDGAISRCSAPDGEIQLAIVDVMMPHMSGRELAERLLLTRPGLKILFISAHGPEVLETVGLDPVRVHFLAKPFLPGALWSAIDVALNRQQGAMNNER
jgi:DNA-binding response OmpR family regulator